MSDYRLAVKHPSRAFWIVQILKRNATPVGAPIQEFYPVDSVWAYTRWSAMRKAKAKVAQMENPPPVEFIDLP